MKEESKDLEIISSANIIDKKTINNLKKIQKDLERGFALRQRFRPRFLMEVSVLNDMKFPTPDSKYWQCNLERDVHFKNLVELCFTFKEKIADIHLLEAELHNLENISPQDEITAAKIEQKKVQIAHQKNTLIFMRKEAYERVREIMNWTDLMAQLEPKLKYSKDNPEEHMPESYSLRFAREREAMRIAGSENAAADLAGAMNIISLGKTAFVHPRVRQLIEEEKEKKEKLGGGVNDESEKVLEEHQS